MSTFTSPAPTRRDGPWGFDQLQSLFQGLTDAINRNTAALESYLARQATPQGETKNA